MSSSSSFFTAQAWPFWALLLLCIIESIAAVRYHVLLCNLPLADTLMLLVSVYRHPSTSNIAAGPLFQRICGCVAFCAILFVNTSHALEMLTESIDREVADNHSHSHEALWHNIPFVSKIESAVVPWTFVPVIAFDLVLKLAALFSGTLPGFGLSLPFQVVLHCITPVSVLGVYLVGLFSPLEGSYFIEHLDPFLAIVICVTCALLIFHAFCEMKPYVFADTPQCFDSDKFSSDISQQFEGVVCSHIHVYRCWPKSRFEALIHISIKVNKDESGWSRTASERYNDIAKYIRSALTKGGADKVVIEPRFIDYSCENPEWHGCVETKCFVEDRGCCSALNDRDSRSDA